jgi:GNAT superfamily N-acetyltransferase
VSGLVIRRVTPDDGALIKDVRLRALATDASSFASPHEREAGYADAEWVEWASADATGDDTTTLLACEDDRPAGIIAAYRNERDPGLFHVAAMWVAPETRGRGVGRFLLETLEAWIAECGGTTAELLVADGSLPARRLFESAGYRPDGAAKMSEHVTGQACIGMRKPLRAAGRSAGEDPRGELPVHDRRR